MTPPGVVSETNQEKLINYLENGGNLYIESVDIGKDYENTSFFEYLGMLYLDDGIEDEVILLKGIEEQPSSDMVMFYEGGDSPHFSLDHLEATNGNFLFKSEDGVGRVIGNEGLNYKTISSSILIGAIANGDTLNHKSYLFSEYVNYFLEYNPISTLQENIESLYSGNYPNPFEKQTTIKFSVPSSGMVNIKIFDINGQLVNQIISTVVIPGKHEVVWDATNTNGSLLKSGFYFYTITFGDQSVTEKMILLR
jgi:hypothetical protein